MFFRKWKLFSIEIWDKYLIYVQSCRVINARIYNDNNRAKWKTNLDHILPPLKYILEPWKISKIPEMNLEKLSLKKIEARARLWFDPILLLEGGGSSCVEIYTPPLCKKYLCKKWGASFLGKQKFLA